MWAPIRSSRFFRRVHISCNLLPTQRWWWEWLVPTWSPIMNLLMMLEMSHFWRSLGQSHLLVMARLTTCHLPQMIPYVACHQLPTIWSHLKPRLAARHCLKLIPQGIQRLPPCLTTLVVVYFMQETQSKMQLMQQDPADQLLLGVVYAAKYWQHWCACQWASIHLQVHVCWIRSGPAPQSKAWFSSALSCVLCRVLLSEKQIWRSQSQDFVQVINICRNHWMCASNVNCSPGVVDVYDSLPACMTKGALAKLKEQVAVILHTSDGDFEVQFRWSALVRIIWL